MKIATLNATNKRVVIKYFSLSPIHGCAAGKNKFMGEKNIFLAGKITLELGKYKLSFQWLISHRNDQKQFNAPFFFTCLKNKTPFPLIVGRLFSGSAAKTVVQGLLLNYRTGIGSP